MKIVIDLQSVQGISKNRGIGRYSLALSQELIRQAGAHEINLALNGNMLDSINVIRESFNGLISQDKIKIFEVPKNISGHDYSNAWRIKAAEKLREKYISTLSPDITYITSIFEGWIEDAPTSIGEISNNSLTAATLYDLIPFIHYDLYIKNNGAQHFFFQKMQYLKKCNLIITLSDSGTQEAIDHLTFPSENIVNCSVGIDSKFKQYHISDDKKIKLKKKYSINRDFIFYIGGLDFRKNVAGLIEAFTLLPNRDKFQLVIIVSANEDAVTNFYNFNKSRFNLNFDELILISYVSEDTLLTLYNICSVFVFPSLHEGFGLPIIEAMACGTPTITSNLSSMPEAIGCKEALFDPKNPQSIASKIYEVVSDENFKNYLIEHGAKQVKKFTWENTAKKSLNALEALYTKNNNKKHWSIKRKRMAYISPLPPEKSGIADYSTLLVPELACFYNIILITEQNHTDNLWLKANFQIHDLAWFLKNVNSFDILFYQFGNSAYHHYMIELLNSYPGIVLLHDFYISGLLDWIEDYIPRKNLIFSQNLYSSHGYPALIYQEKEGRINTHSKYPCNLSVLNKATGIIVHSKYSIDLAKKWYGNNITKKFKSINHLAHANLKIFPLDKILAKKKLGFKENDFLICSFGNLHPNKLNHRLISSSLNLLIKNENTYLIFIGEEPYRSYYDVLLDFIKKNNLNKKIRFIGYSENQLFQSFLLASDISIQLRENSRGETSGCLLMCLSYGIPTIANAHGSIKELPDEIIVKLQDKFTDLELTEAIDKLQSDNELRSKLSKKAILYITNNCHPARIGEEIFNTIEDFYTHNKSSENNLIKELMKYNSCHMQKEDLLEFSKIIAANRPSSTYPQLFIDVSNIIDNSNNLDIYFYEKIIKGFISTFSIKLRPEPIYFNSKQNNFFYAYQYVNKLLNLTNISNLEDLPIDIYDTDIFITVFTNTLSKNFLYHLNKKNIKIYLFLLIEFQQSQMNFILDIADGIICLNIDIFNSLNNAIKSNRIQLNRSFNVSILKDELMNDLSKEIYDIILNNSWEIKIKENNLSRPEIISLNRDIYINKIKYNFDGDIRYLSGAPKDFDVITLSIFQNFCKNNSYVLDLGANIGFTAIALADICFDGKIAAVEPLEPTFNFLRKNINKSEKNNITLHQYAVGNKTGEFPMQATSDFLAGAFIADQYQADQNHFTMSVKINLLDDIFEEFNFDKLDFIKMDLEGYEIFALEGGIKTLNKFQPTVFLEMNHWCLNVFHRISLPEFQERLCQIFPYIYAIEYPNFLDFTCKNNFYHIAHEHVTTTCKYFNLIAGFNHSQILDSLTKTVESIKNYQF
jgi:FkbM family methyltransferase